ncbi:hypothetical protein B0A48_05418 [Cryoendolithus antarcticus]|uniref:Cytochrome c oxidase assembly protein COX15 n=1 Tax=Cryoendolithus antarcticus TaxID=1507870 RepID=A0A1V8TIW7_9PEZI|nr:hypothetical protein B0A48_05418 [Cryoendolithus antarcticus]
MALSPIRTRLALRANRLVDNSFVCRRCLHQQKSPSVPPRQTPFLDAFRKPGHYRIPPSARYTSSTALPSASPLGALGSAFGSTSENVASRAANTNRTSSFPTTSSKSAAYWLLASAASVFGIVVLGGLTRLTESGLSIVEWRPVTGSFPPLNDEDWEREFSLYKLSPEFKMLNSRMGLEEYKQIYWMEWGHRLWGRVVGITFLLPTAYFIARGKVSAPMAVRLVGICGLIGFQGFLGWWMVKSGLKDDLFAPGSHPRVSQYRLAAHLGTAFAAYLAMLWNGLAILRQHRLLANPTASLAQLSHLSSPALKPFRLATAILFGLTYCTAISGALVAGLDAGLVYNDFPWMGQPRFIPPKSELLSTWYSHTPSPHPDLIWRNMLENPAFVQLDHRILATTTFVSIMGLWAYSRRLALPRPVQKGVAGVVGYVSLQVIMGITTLWYLVPTPLAAAHQAGALALLSGVLVLGSRVRVSKRTMRLVQEAASRVRQVGQRGPEAMMKARMAGV